MRAILDNATISAALRAIGIVKNPDHDLYDLDVAALRTVVDAIVLADRVIVLDNYKPEYTEVRKELFSADFIDFMALPPAVDGKLRQHAIAHVHNWELAKRLGTTYAGLLDELTVLFRHAWRKSEGFLVFKAFGVQSKYNSAIMKGLFNVGSDEAADVAAIASTTEAKIYNRETHRVIQMLVWAAVRTVYYRQAAKLMGCEYLPHPLRHGFNLQCILFDNHPDTRTLKLHSEYRRRTPLLTNPAEHIATFMKGLWETCNSADDNVFGVETFDLTIPPFLGVTIKNAEQYSDATGHRVLEAAFELRTEAGPTALRKRLAELWTDTEEDGDTARLREFTRELSELRRRMQVYLGYDRERVSLSAKLMSYPVTVPRCMTKPFYPGKPHLAFIRDVILELASVGSMSRLLDSLWRLKERTTT